MMLNGLLSALSEMASWHVVLSIFAGLVAGYCIGSLPGLSSSIGIALLIPFTFAMQPVDSIVMLVTLYVATEYAGAIPAILVNTPGIPAAAITALDGYPMRLRGEAGTALTLSILSAAFGSILSTLLLIVTSTSLASVALAFGPVEYFAVAVLGLSLVSSLSGHSMLKGFVGLFFGLGIGLIGTDPIDGVTRYVFADSLLSGVGFLPALIGLFALSSIFSMIEEFDPSGTAARQASECLRTIWADEAALLDFAPQHAHRLLGECGARPWCDNFGGGVLRLPEKGFKDT